MSKRSETLEQHIESYLRANSFLLTVPLCCCIVHRSQGKYSYRHCQKQMNFNTTLTWPWIKTLKLLLAPPSSFPPPWSGSSWPSSRPRKVFEVGGVEIPARFETRLRWVSESSSGSCGSRGGWSKTCAETQPAWPSLDRPCEWQNSSVWENAITRLGRRERGQENRKDTQSHTDGPTEERRTGKQKGHTATHRWTNRKRETVRQIAIC